MMDLGFEAQDSTFSTWLQNFFDDDKPVSNEDCNSDDRPVTNKASNSGNRNKRSDKNNDDLPTLDFSLKPEEEKSFEVPGNDPTPEDVRKLLAKDMERMDVNERGMIYEEIHGVHKLIEETPQFLSEKLADMDVALLHLSSTPSSLNASEFDADAYNQAMAIDADYVRSLRLVFLRTDYFEVEAAAHRMIHFFHEKLQIYGEDALARPLYLIDLGDDGMTYLRAGFSQLLPVRDNAGRAVFCCTNSVYARGKFSVTDMLKAWAYVMLAAAEDEETQKRGIVCVIYLLDLFKTITVNRDMIYKVPTSLKWLPIRHTGYHFCSQDPALRSFFALAIYATPRQNRNHIRIHEGSPTECRYNMMTFGIPTGAIPVTANLKLKLDNHRKWLSRRAAKDAHIQQQRALLRHDDVVAAPTVKNQPVVVPSFRAIDFPGPHDVLLGRGKPHRDHSGTVRMRQLVQLHQSTYDSMGDVLGQKTKVAKAIIELIRNSEPKGRFLKIHPDHGWWVEASQAEAIEKVSQAFRTARASSSSSSKATASSATASTVRMVDGQKRTKVMLSAGA